jgi:hypothetical protein
MIDPRLALVTAAIHLRRHPSHPHHCRCEEFARAALDAIQEGRESVEVVRGWRYHNDGSMSPVERWVKHADGDWVSLDSTRRTSGDIHVIPPAKPQDGPS